MTDENDDYAFEREQRAQVKACEEMLEIARSVFESQHPAMLALEQALREAHGRLAAKNSESDIPIKAEETAAE